MSYSVYLGMDRFKQIILLCFINILYFNSVNAQELTFIGLNIVPNEEDTIRIGNISLESCTYSTELFFFANSILFYTDITFDTNNTYYGFVPVSPPPVSLNRLTSMVFDPFFVGTTVEDFNETKEGMTCDKQGNLYLAGEKLSRWNSTNGQVTELGDLPASMYCQGDLTFRQGKLYMSTIENTLVEVDLNNPMNSSVVMTFPPGTPEIHGLATVNLECDSVETYAVASTLFDGSTIYRIDFDTWTLEEICHFNFFISGLASYDECIFPDCLINVDLDADNSAQAVGENDFRYEQACNFPVAISDTDINIHSDLEMLDSIVITLTNSVNAEEWLSLASGYNVDVLGNQTDHLTIINNGMSEVADFTNALRNILYNNVQSPLQYGERIIEVKAWFGLFESGIAKTNVPIDETIIDPFFTIDSVSCFGFVDASISANPSGSVGPYSFLWNDGSAAPQIDQLSSGQYHLTIFDAFGCTNSFEIELSDPDSLTAFIINSTFDTICDFTGILQVEADGGTGTYSYLWDDGFTGFENENLEAGSYTVTVEDTNGCTATADYTLFEGGDIINNNTQTSCFGTEVIIDGQIYASDTSFCLIYTLGNGCDSLECYDLDFYEENNNVLSESICKGDSILIQGAYYSRDTTVNFMYIDMNGCDSLISYELNIFEEPVIDFETSGSLCVEEEVLVQVEGFENYEWSTGENESFIIINEAGTYQVTATDNNNCIASSEIFIDDPQIEIELTTFDLTCFESADGIIRIDSVTGGTAPYLFKLNDSPFILDSTFDNLSAGTYLLEVQDAQGCIEFVNIELIQPGPISIVGEDNYSVTLGTSIDIMIGTNAVSPQISWSPSNFLDCTDCFENSITPANSISYEVVVTDGTGCTAIKIISIDVSEDINIFVPNIFTPNGDSKNDVLTVYANPDAVPQIIDLTIMSRNGHVVHQSQNFSPNDFNAGWDGTFRGKRAQSGVYILYVTFEKINGQIEQEIYTITLLR